MLAVATVRCTAQAKAPAAPAFERAQQEARRILEGEELLAEMSAFRVHGLDTVRGETLHLGDTVLHAPALARLGEAMTGIAAGACTLGPGVEARVSSLFQAKKPLVAMALDELASEKLFRLSDRLHVRIRSEARRQGLRLGDTENPGDAGIPLGEQQRVLALAGMHAIGVSRTGMLSPVKSLSFVVPLGPSLAPSSIQPRCAHCASRERCSMRTAHATRP